MRAQQHTSGFSASFWLYVQKSDLLIRFSSGFAAYEPFGKPGSLSDPHRLREEKPDAGLDFHLPAQQTDPEGGGGGREKPVSPVIRNPQQVNVAHLPVHRLIRLRKRRGVL